MTSQTQTMLPRYAVVATLAVTMLAAEAQAAGLGNRTVFGGRTYVNNSINDPNYGAGTSETRQEGWQWQDLGTLGSTDDLAAQSDIVTTTRTRQQQFAEQQQSQTPRRFGLGWQYQERLFGNNQGMGVGRPVVTRPTNNNGQAVRQPRYLTVRPSNWGVVRPGTGSSVGNNNNNGNGSQAQLTALQRYEIQWMRRLIDRQTTAAAMSTLAASRSTSDAELAALYNQMAAEQAQQVDQLQSWLNEWYDLDYDPDLGASAERQLTRYADLNDDAFHTSYARWLVLQQSALQREIRQINSRAAHTDLSNWAHGLVDNDDDDDDED